MQELVTSVHIHSVFSDGTKTHQEIIDIAAQTGIDVLFFTDHNIFLKEIEGYYDIHGQKVLVIMGEEIHDASAFPQKNHLLALGIKNELSGLSDNREALINQIHQQYGAAFLAHPFDPALPDFNEPNISWNDWSVENFDGIELWNGFSELKVRSKNKIDAYFFAFFKKFLPFQPPKETLQIWDNLLHSGKKISAIAGSDAHAIKFSAGPFHRILYPYAYHFSTINNHLLIKEGISGDFFLDKKRVVASIAEGHNFIANDLIHSAKGFQFHITSQKGEQIEMGETAQFSKGQFINLVLPSLADVRIKKDGRIVYNFKDKGEFHIEIFSPGIYRIECYRKSRFKNRGWIFSNPIYIL